MKAEALHEDRGQDPWMLDGRRVAPLPYVSYDEFMRDCYAKRSADPSVEDIQRAEEVIHPKLKGVQVHFWISKSKHPKEDEFSFGMCGVTFSGGDTGKLPPWFPELHKKIFKDQGVAKRWLFLRAHQLDEKSKEKK